MSPELFSVVHDRAGANPRVIFKRNEGERKENIFIAEFDPEDGILQTVWNSRKSPEDFRDIAEKEYAEEIDWKPGGDLKGEIGSSTFLWLASRIGRAGIQLTLSKSKNTNDSLGKITKIASNTVTDGISLPENLQAKLEEFVSSLPSTPKQAPV